MEIDRVRAQTRGNLRFARLWQGLGWLMIVIVVTLSLMPDPPELLPIVTWDKAQHLLGYAGLMFWFAQVHAARVRWIVFLILLGVGIEFVQGWSGYRNFDYGDMLADALGVGCGFLLAATPLGLLVARLDRALGVWSRRRA